MTLVAMSHRSSVPTSPHLPSKLVKSSEGSVEPLQNLISSHVDEAEIALLPIINFTLNHDDLFSGAITIVKKLFPTWQEANLLLVQCKDGITNKLVKVSHKGASSEPAILIRAYGKGSELLIDRNQELRNLLVLSKLGLGPKVYGRFNNGIAYGFVAGDMFSVDDMRDPQRSALVAKRLHQWHTTSLPPNAPPRLFSTIRKWISILPNNFKPKSPIHTKSWLIELVDSLQPALESVHSSTVFCHNDLLYGNIIYQDGCARFIDYEYGCPNPRAFDIANHFCEWAGFECDYKKYPNEAQQRHFVKNYCCGGEDVEVVMMEVKLYSPAPHLFWGVWALVQSTISDIDFDYLGYAELRFAEMESLRSQVGV